MVTVQIVCDKPLRISNERWIRLPKKGYCEWCGLSRSHLFTLVADGKVRSVSLKKPGNQRGVRLGWLPSVFEYIERVGVLEGPESSEADDGKAAPTYTLSLAGIEGLSNM